MLLCNFIKFLAMEDDDSAFFYEAGMMIDSNDSVFVYFKAIDLIVLTTIPASNSPIYK